MRQVYAKIDYIFELHKKLPFRICTNFSFNEIERAENFEYFSEKCLT